ncbi:hypothetical protein H7Y21_00905 [Arenimonas sp.]|nr:hypothetical protein [Candidatus Parcubacteria bacterium]
MRIHNSLRNNFFGVFLFLVLLVPGVVGAAYDYGTTNTVKLKQAGWSDVEIKKLNQNVNNLNTGSTYKSFYNGIDLSVNLYNTDPKKNSLTPIELEGLKEKLKEGGSNVKQETLVSEKVYQINDGNTTNYVYDPTPDNKTNNDTVVLGTATSERLFLSYKTPVAKERVGATRDENVTSKSANSLDGVLNANDIANGRQSGATISKKNYITNLEVDQANLIQQKVDAEDEVNRLQQQLQQSTDPTQTALIQKSLADATARMNNASSSLTGVNNSLSGAYNAQAAASYNARNTTPTTCGTPSAGGLITNYFNINCVVSLVSWITNIIFKFTSFIAYIAGTLFDYSLELSINSAQFFKKLGVIEITWQFIRDILNMTFIFILLWTAVQILIGNDAKYNAKQVLTKVIIVAILINFSLFAAKLMVDGSNVVSLKIYEAMKQPSTEGKDASISERIMNTVGLSTLYNVTDIFDETKTKSPSGCVNNPGGLITIAIMGSIFLIILSLALGLAGILFLVRLVNIIILFIKSPLWVWGYVLPGNSFVSKQKDEWWSQMMHVLTFPIVYLFWMLVAVIIFDSLSSAKTETGGLLALICNTPGTQNGGAGTMISLVAIFCIVIIFMMKAIEYGVSHAAGPKGSVGGAFSTKMANKFAGYQTAMTKGLAKKAGSGVLAVGGISAGAANRGLLFARDTAGRVGGAGISALHKGEKEDNVWKRAKDGFFNPGIETKEAFRDMARKTVVSTQGGALDYLGVTSKAAKIAEKYKDPTNKAGETKKQADARRSSNAVADETRKADAIEQQFKILTGKEWLKKNSGGTLAQYKQYVENKIETRTDAVYGKNIVNAPAANGNTHLENLREAAVVEYEEEKRDANGRVERDTTGKAIMEKKFKLDEYAMRGAMQKMAKEDKVKDLLKSQKTKFTTFQHIEAEARIKALDTNEKTQRVLAKKKTDDSEKTRNYENDIPDLKETIEKMELQKGDVDAAVGAKVQLMINPQTDYNGKPVRAVNSAIAKLNLERRKGGGADPSKILKLEETLANAHQTYTDHIKKTRSDLTEKETAFMDHLAKLDEKK